MKSILLILFILPVFGFSQSNIPHYNFTFEDTTHEHFMYRDTVSNPNCVWQVGVPQKAVFTSSQSLPNSIVTDTINSYPINDTSAFIIKHEVGGGYLQYGVPIMQLYARYFVNSDSLNDFGKIEFSPDNGNSWILISDDTLDDGNNTWPSSAYFALTGSSNGWKSLYIDMSTYNYTTFISGDTVQYRFTFISDSNFDNLDGLMFDDINVVDFAGGGVQGNSNSGINIYPNPFTNSLNLSYDNLSSGSLSIYDVNGKLVHSEIINNSNATTVDTSDFIKGVYFYILVDTNTGLSVYNGKVVK
jgi:hypothetical protein